MLSFSSNIRLSHLVIAGHLMALLLLVATCNFKSQEPPLLSGVVHFSGKEFAGSQACAGCHASIAASHVHTPHYLTSTLADSLSVRGSFDSTENVLVLNDRLKVLMKKTSSGMFQQGFVDGVEVETRPMELTIGSARKGQSFLYWEDHALFQLPASYYTAGDSWSNSPGFPQNQLAFNRNIPARCLECHSTYFKTEKFIAGKETFNPDQMMLGVDCERCHGPAADHVRFHLEHPDEKQAKAIVNPARLSRQQKLDNCALCHSGIRENLMPAFSYVVGERLEDYSYPSYPADSAATLDVHGNQYGLLLESKCFRATKMDCSTCHDVHVKETGQLSDFSARCMSCHTPGTANFCKQPLVPGLDITRNCIDCHMPALPSRQLFVRSADNPEPASFFVRTHLIGVYDKNIEDFLDRLGQDNP